LAHASNENSTIYKANFECETRAKEFFNSHRRFHAFDRLSIYDMAMLRQLTTVPRFYLAITIARLMQSFAHLVQFHQRLGELVQLLKIAARRVPLHIF
jgi:hypothetical protein